MLWSVGAGGYLGASSSAPCAKTEAVSEETMTGGGGVVKWRKFSKRRAERKNSRRCKQRNEVKRSKKKKKNVRRKGGGGVLFRKQALLGKKQEVGRQGCPHFLEAVAAPGEWPCCAVVVVESPFRLFVFNSPRLSLLTVVSNEQA